MDSVISKSAYRSNLVSVFFHLAPKGFSPRRFVPGGLGPWVIWTPGDLAPRGFGFQGISYFLANHVIPGDGNLLIGHMIFDSSKIPGLIWFELGRFTVRDPKENLGFRWNPLQVFFIPGSWVFPPGRSRNPTGSFLFRAVGYLAHSYHSPLWVK